MNVNPINNINYKGIPIANIKVKGEDACYKLYNINHKDYNFLKQVYSNINLKKLMPRLQENDYTIWDEIIKNAIKLSKNTHNKSILETYNNIPCGIITYNDLINTYHVNYVATFPTKKNKRVPCAGQVLFNELLKRLIKSDKKTIELSAVRNAPFSPISTYIKLGFGMLGGDDYCEYMNINKEKAVKTISKQDEFIKSETLVNQQYIDLYKEINLDFGL